MVVMVAAVLDAATMMAAAVSSDDDISILLFHMPRTATTTDQAPLKHPFSVFSPLPLRSVSGTGCY